MAGLGPVPFVGAARLPNGVAPDEAPPPPPLDAITMTDNDLSVLSPFHLSNTWKSGWAIERRDKQIFFRTFWKKNNVADVVAKAALIYAKYDVR